jgi:hypothetical protein
LRLRLSMGAAGARHAAARFTGITSLPRWKICTTASWKVPGSLTRRRGCVIRTPYALGLPLYVIHEEAGGIPVSDNYYPTLQPVAVLHLRCLGPTQRRDPVSSSMGDSWGPLRHLTLDAQPQRRREVLRLVVLANAHASPVRLGLVLGKHALHLLPALVVQHA